MRQPEERSTTEGLPNAAAIANHKCTHLPPGEKRVLHKFTGLDNNTITHDDFFGGYY